MDAKSLRCLYTQRSGGDIYDQKVEVLSPVPSIPTKRPQIYAQNSPGEGGRDQLLKDGQQLKEVERFSNIEGYAIFESDSMDKVLWMINAFFPFYS
jgi:hypothetical protein